MRALFAMGFALLITGADDELPAIPEIDPSGYVAYKVTDVVDGDTIKVDVEGEKLTVRLIGVNTPETVHPHKPVERLGLAASKFTTSLLEGEQVFLEPDQGELLEKDRYGRALAHVWRVSDGMYINLEIVHQGYSYAYTKYPFNEDRMILFRAYAQDAREHERGLWGLDDEEENRELVYHIGSGGKYHRANCQYVSGKSSVTEHTVSESKRNGWTPCKRCEPPE